MKSTVNIQFPNGFESWVATFYIMAREIDGIRGYDEVVRTKGSTYFFDQVDKYAEEFELLNLDKNWDDGSYEDEVIEFLNKKIKELL